MIKIDFEHLKIYQNIAKSNFIVVDTKEQIADSIYQRGQGIAFHALALKIYNSKDGCELTDEEYNMLMSHVKNVCTPMVIDALSEYKKDDGNKE